MNGAADRATDRLLRACRRWPKQFIGGESDVWVLKKAGGPNRA